MRRTATRAGLRDRSRRRATRTAERGAVTAELALALPLLVAVTVGLVWLLAVGGAQIRAIDAAREAARVAARGDSSSEAVGRGERVAPPGAAVTVDRSGGQVVARVRAGVPGPGGLFDFLPRVTVRAEAVATDEEAP